MNYTYLSGSSDGESIKDIDYSQSNVGGNPAVNLATGRVQYVFPDASIGAGNYAVNIAHVYNSKLNAVFANRIKGFGSNWKLNLTQFVVPDGSDGSGRSILKYMDESGEIHRYVSFAANKWYNDRKATSTIELINGYYVLSDGVGNKLWFDSSGRLIRSVSCQNVNMVKLYKYDSGNRLISVCDQRAQKKHIDLSYDSTGRLVKMTAYVNNSRPVSGFKYRYDADNNLTEVCQVAYGTLYQSLAEKQILQFRYQKGNLQMIIDAETNAASLLAYDNAQRIRKLSSGVVRQNCVQSGMTDSANNSVALCDSLQSGMSCEPNFTEKSYNAFRLQTLADDNVSLMAQVTNEKGITLLYYIDRQACITSSFELDKQFTGEGTNLKTLVKYEGQCAPSSNTGSLGYINKVRVQSSQNPVVNVNPARFIDGKFVQTYERFNFCVWVKIGRAYGLLELKATYKNDASDAATKESAVMINPQAVNAWQRVVIPLELPVIENAGFRSAPVTLSLVADKNACTDYFEFALIGLAPSPVTDLKVPVDESNYLPLSRATQVKLTLSSVATETLAITKDFYLTETDVISSYVNKYKNNGGSFDLIFNNGTNRRAGVTDVRFYFPLVGWSSGVKELTYGYQPFSIYTVLPVKDAVIETRYEFKRDNSGFEIINDYAKKIDGTIYTSRSSVKMDYTGKTLYELDEYKTRKAYEYNSDGTLKKLMVVNVGDIQSVQTFEYKEGLLVSVDDGLNKRQITYNEQTQAAKVRDFYRQGGDVKDSEHIVANSIGIFGDNLGVSEYYESAEVTSKRLTYQDGFIRTISDGVVKYGIRRDVLNDRVMYTQFDGSQEKLIQEDTVSKHVKAGTPYSETHTSVFYDKNGNVADSSFVDVDAYGKPLQQAKSTTATSKFLDGNSRERYRYVYDDAQESGFTKKPSACEDFDNYSATEFDYDGDGNLIGWRETEFNQTLFEVRQITPTTTKYIFGDTDNEEYHVKVEYDKHKTASPRIEKIVYQQDKNAGIDKPTDMFQAECKWTPLGSPSEVITEFSTETYGYSALNNNLLLSNINYNSKATYSTTTSSVDFSDNIKYYDNGLIRQETIISQVTSGGLVPTRKPASTSVREYEYDNLHRITKESNSGLDITRTYSYYANGRLKSISDSRDGSKNFYYNSQGNLISINNSTTFAYDNFGNRISKTVNGVTSRYTYDVGGRLVSAGGVRYSYNAEGVRCKKTAVGAAKGEKMYLDGGKILGEDRADYKLRYFYDTTGLKRIYKIEKYNTYIYECVKDSQGSIVMLLNTTTGAIACRYEYDALGKCTIIINSNDDIANINPFRWKGFFYDSESGFYYANGSYYDPETGLYVDAAPVSAVFDNADSPRYIDRNGTLCYNPLELAGSPYTVFTVAEMSEDPLYSPGQTWWDNLWEKISLWVQKISSWWESIPNWQKVLAGGLLILASLAVACATGGSSLGLEAQLLGTSALASVAKMALIEMAIGVGFAVADWALNGAMTGDWSASSLEDNVANAIFFTGAFLFVSTSVNAIKYAYRADPYPVPTREAPDLGNKLDYAFGQATGRQHSVNRSTGMLQELERIGIRDNVAGRSLLRENLIQAYYTPNNILGPGKYAGQVIKESFLVGPHGYLVVQSTWQRNVLKTIMFKR